MTKPTTLIALFLICTCIATAQDTLNFANINAAMEPAQVVIGEHTYTYKKITPVKLAEVCDYPPYNKYRKEAYKELSQNLDQLNESLAGLGNPHLQTSKKAILFNFQTFIDRCKKFYPNLDISSYEAIYRALGQQVDDEKVTEMSEEEKEKKRAIAQRRYEAEKRRAAEQQEQQKAINEKQQDSLEATAMLTVEEAGQEYEVGYQKEYRAQMGLMSQHAHLCRFIGFKFYWVTHIPKYLIEEETFNMTSGALGDDRYLVIKMTPTGRNEAFYGKLQIKAKVDKDDRVTSMVITGSSMSLTHLFLWYWPTTVNLTRNAKLKTGVTYRKTVYDEDIVFNYSATPSIVIKKSSWVKIKE